MKNSILILLIFSIACSPKEKVENNYTNANHLNTAYSIEKMKHKQFNRSDVLDSFEGNRRAKIFRDSILHLTNCNCEINNGLLSIKIDMFPGWTYQKLEIYVDSYSFYSAYKHWGDIESENYISHPIYQELKLSSNQFEDSTWIDGHIKFDGITFTNYLQEINHFEVNLEGDFTCLIKENKTGYNNGFKICSDGD